MCARAGVRVILIAVSAPRIKNRRVRRSAQWGIISRWHLVGNEIKRARYQIAIGPSWCARKRPLRFFTALPSSFQGLIYSPIFSLVFVFSFSTITCEYFSFTPSSYLIQILFFFSLFTKEIKCKHDWKQVWSWLQLLLFKFFHQLSTIQYFWSGKRNANWFFYNQ